MKAGKYQHWDNDEEHPFWETLLLHMINNDWFGEDSDDFWKDLNIIFESVQNEGVFTTPCFEVKYPTQTGEKT